MRVLEVSRSRALSLMCEVTLVYKNSLISTGTSSLSLSFDGYMIISLTEDATCHTVVGWNMVKKLMWHENKLDLGKQLA